MGKATSNLCLKNHDSMFYKLAAIQPQSAPFPLPQGNFNSPEAGTIISANSASAGRLLHQLMQISFPAKF